MNGALLVQAVAGGLATGAVYGLVGLGFGLIYQMSGVLNFAHGDLVTASIFTLLLVAGGGAAVAAVGVSPALLSAGALVAVLAAVAAALLIQQAAVAPFLDRPQPPGAAGGGGATVGWVATTVAAGLLLRSLVGLWFQADSYTVPETLPVRWLSPTGTLSLPGGGVLQARAIIVLAVAMAAALAFDRWLKTSRHGLGMRAAAQDPLAARLCGVSPRRMQLVAWGIAGALAALAGILLAPTRPVSLDLGVILGLKGIAAAVLGRLGPARGTVLAGLALGVGERLVTTLSIPAAVIGGVHLGGLGPLPALQDTGPLLLLLVVLALRPGRLGSVAEAID